MSKTTLSVAAIESGTVIDHISRGAALQIVRLLDLASDARTVTVGLNLPSKDHEYKDLIKVVGKHLTEAEVDRIAILSPHATVNVIDEYTVMKKYNVSVPHAVQDVIVCPNPSCITAAEPCPSVFYTTVLADVVELTCHYCERTYAPNEIRSYLT